MSLVDMLKQAGFKPEKSTEGEYQPLEGIYKVQFVKAEQVKSDKTGTNQLRCEFKVTETLTGDDSYSKFNEFRKFLALEGENANSPKKGVKFILNAIYTAGTDISLGDNETELISNIQSALGTTVYMNAYGWTPEDSEKTIQMFNPMKESVAIKKAEEARKKSGVGF